MNNAFSAAASGKANSSDQQKSSRSMSDDRRLANHHASSPTNNADKRPYADVGAYTAGERPNKRQQFMSGQAAALAHEEAKLALSPPEARQLALRSNLWGNSSSSGSLNISSPLLSNHMAAAGVPQPTSQHLHPRNSASGSMVDFRGNLLSIPNLANRHAELSQRQLLARYFPSASSQQLRLSSLSNSLSPHSSLGFGSLAAAPGGRLGHPGPHSSASLAASAAAAAGGAGGGMSQSSLAALLTLQQQQQHHQFQHHQHQHSDALSAMASRLQLHHQLQQQQQQHHHANNPTLAAATAASLSPTRRAYSASSLAAAAAAGVGSSNSNASHEGLQQLQQQLDTASSAMVGSAASAGGGLFPQVSSLLPSATMTTGAAAAAASNRSVASAATSNSQAPATAGNLTSTSLATGTTTATTTVSDETSSSHSGIATMGAPIPLGIDEDCCWLSDFHVFVRKNLVELCWASSEDVALRNTSNRVSSQQVGIRCRCCAHLNPSARAQRSSAFPSSIAQIYQSFTMMLRAHFSSCTEVPEPVKQRFLALKSKTTQGATDSKQYWIYSARKLGMVDTEDGIIMTKATTATARSIPPFGTEDAPQDESSDESSLAHQPMVLPNDRSIASDFLYTLLLQARRVRLQANEQRGNKKSLQLGLPGFACRHCCALGRMGQCRIFPARRRTLPTKIYDLYEHLLRCSACPPETVELLQVLHDRENYQPKMPGRKEFLDLIWSRLVELQPQPQQGELEGAAASLKGRS